MSKISETIHNHHQQISDTLRGYVAGIVEGSASADPEALVRFLRADLIPHAVGEERYLYPAVDPLVKAHGSATATMAVDHEFITGYIDRIDKAARTLAAARPEERTVAQAELQRLSLQLEALLLVHLEKEERVYIPLFEKYLSEEEQARVLDGMHEGTEEEQDRSLKTALDQVLDVREIPPRVRHALIFATFDSLAPDSAFVLVNDHDPRPLYYQFNAERDGLFTWEYLEQGPEEWQVRIAKVGGASAAAKTEHDLHEATTTR